MRKGKVLDNRAKVTPTAQVGDDFSDLRQLTFLEGVLRHNIMKHRHSWPFNKPVDPIKLKIPDYLEKIKTPMDFGTIKKRLDNNKYTKTEDCIKDIELVFSNCYMYNLPEMDIYAMAKEVEQVFREQLRRMPTVLNRKNSDD